MKIGFWELVVVVIVAFVFIGPDQLPVYAKKIGKMLRELKKYTGAASEEIQKNVVEPLNEIQAPLKEAVAPLTDIKKDIDNSVKDVTKGFTGIGKTSKEEAAKKAAEEEVTDLTAEEPVEELPEENAAPAAEPAAEKAEAPAEEKPETAPVQGRNRPRTRTRSSGCGSSPGSCRGCPGRGNHRLSFGYTAPRGCHTSSNKPATRRGKVKRRFLLCVLVLTNC